MKLNATLYVLVIVLLASILISCNKESTIKDLYDGDLSKIDRIEVTNGTNGEKTIVEDKEIINVFINDIKSIVFVRKNDNSKGYLYQLSFYEGEQLTFSMNESSIDDNSYQSKKEIKELIERMIHKSET